MDATLRSLLDLYIFPGRREFALRRLADLAREAGHDELAEHAEAAVAHERRTRRLRRTRAAADRAPANPRLRELDLRMGRTLSALHDVPGEMGRALGGDVAEAASAFQNAAFPQGVAAITSANWPEAAAATADLLTLFDGPREADVDRFHLQALVDQLRADHQEFVELLDANADATITLDALHARDAAGQDHLEEAVARVLGLFPRATLTDTRARAALLAPVIEQSEQIRRTRARRRPATDIDPDTGAPIDEDDAPAPPPADDPDEA